MIGTLVGLIPDAEQHAGRQRPGKGHGDGPDHHPCTALLANIVCLPVAKQKLKARHDEEFYVNNWFWKAFWQSGRGNPEIHRRKTL